MEYLIETVADGVFDTQVKALVHALQTVVNDGQTSRLYAIRTWPDNASNKWKLAFYHKPSISPADHLSTFKALHDGGNLSTLSATQSWCVAVGEVVTRYKDMASLKVTRLRDVYSKATVIPLYLPQVSDHTLSS